MDIIIPVIGLSAIISAAVCFVMLCVKDALEVGTDISKKLTFKSVKIAPEDGGFVYRFDREDFERGICEESEIGEIVEKEDLKARCEKAEKTDCIKYRYGKNADNYR